MHRHDRPDDRGEGSSMLADGSAPDPEDDDELLEAEEIGDDLGDEDDI